MEIVNQKYAATCRVISLRPLSSSPPLSSSASINILCIILVSYIMFLTQRIPRKKIQRSFEENNLIDGLASSRLPLSRIDHIINTHKLGHSYEGRILDKRKTRTRDVRAERSDESEHFEPRVKKYRVNDRDVKEASRTYLG